MRLIITGRQGSGKTTVRELLEAERKNLDLEEYDLSDFIDGAKDLYREEDHILLIDTPALLCDIRTQKNFLISLRNRESDCIKYVTELPKCTIIKNDNSLDMLRVIVKKFIKKL